MIGWLKRINNEWVLLTHELIQPGDVYYTINLGYFDISKCKISRKSLRTNRRTLKVQSIDLVGNIDHDEVDYNSNVFSKCNIIDNIITIDQLTFEYNITSNESIIKSYNIQ